MLIDFKRFKLKTYVTHHRWNLMLCFRRQEAWIISLLQNIIADSIIKEGLLGPKLILFMTIYPYYVYKNQAMCTRASFIEQRST